MDEQTLMNIDLKFIVKLDKEIRRNFKLKSYNVLEFKKKFTN